MDIEEFRKSIAYKQAINDKKLNALEKEFILKKAELNSLYKKLEKLHDKRMILEGKKDACMDILRRIRATIKSLQQ